MRETLNLYFCAYVDSFHKDDVLAITAPNASQAAVSFLGAARWGESPDSTRWARGWTDVQTQRADTARCTTYRTHDLGDLFFTECLGKANRRGSGSLSNGPLHEAPTTCPVG